MNKHIFITCGFFALMVTGGLAAAEDKPAEAAPTAIPEPSGDTIIATINGQDVSLDLFRYLYTERLRQANAENTPEFQNRVFNEMVNMLVTAQDGQKTGLDKDKGFRMALDVQRLQLLSRYAIQNAVNSFKPSEEDLHKAYDELYSKEKRLEYKARHILVKTEEEGKKLIGELKGGADFAELAKTHSLGPTGKDGGALSWFGSGQREKSFADATAALKPGEYSSEPVQTKYGWHVIMLEETRETDPPAFEDVKNQLTVALQQGALAKYVAELREKADLKLNDELIKVTGESQAKPADSK
jgi:peptidyl-prolyl cis-trans isomerase C